MDCRSVFQFFFTVVCISLTHISRAHRPVVLEFTVDSSDRYVVDVVKTGVRQYTLYKKYASYRDHPFTITCSVEIIESLSASLTINPVSNYNRKSPETIPRARNRYILRERKSYTWYRHEISRENFSCQLSVSAQNADSRLLYITESEIQIIFSSENYICSSSVGETGYVGESVFFVYDGYSRVDRRKYYVESPNSDSNSFQEILSSSSRGMVCSGRYNRGYNNRIPLNQDNMLWLVKPYLEVSLFPPNFTINSKLNFTCRSTPPRMLYWTILGPNGYLFDVASMDPIFMVDTNVTVKQKPGETTLNISESIPGRNGITLVTCSTYDTEAYVVASSNHVSSENTEDVSNCNTPSPPVTTIQSTQESTPALTNIRTTSAGPAQKTASASVTHGTNRQLNQLTCVFNCEQCTNTAAISDTTPFVQAPVNLNTNSRNFPDVIRKHTCFNNRGDHMSEEADFVVPILITLIVLFILVTVILLSGIIWYVRSKPSKSGHPSYNPAPSKPGVKYDGVPSATVMHDNPAYMPSSSEASDGSQDEGADDEAEYRNQVKYQNAVEDRDDVKYQNRNEDHNKVDQRNDAQYQNNDNVEYRNEVEYQNGVEYHNEDMYTYANG